MGRRATVKYCNLNCSNVVSISTCSTYSNCMLVNCRAGGSNETLCHVVDITTRFLESSSFHWFMVFNSNFYLVGLKRKFTA